MVRAVTWPVTTMGHSINLPCPSFNRVDEAHAHRDALESTWKVNDFMGSWDLLRDNLRKREREGRGVGLDAGRGD